MDDRRWSYDPHAPPREEPAGWVVAGEEYTARPRHGGDRGGTRWYGPGPHPEPEPPPPTYPAQGSPAPAYPAHHREPYPAGAYPGASYPQASYPPDGYPAGPAYPPGGRSGARRPAAPAEAYEEYEQRPSWTAALLWTAGLFVVPVLLYMAWALTRSGVAPAGCVDVTGAPCPPPRVEAIDKLWRLLPALGGAFTLALLTAVGVRRVAVDWRAHTVGFAAAVIGAGVMTLATAVVN